MSHPPSLPIFFCLGSWFFFLSLSPQEEKKKKKSRHTHTKKEREMKISAFFPLEKYLPLVSRGKSKIKTKSEMPRVFALFSRTNKRKKQPPPPFSLARSIFSPRAKRCIKSTLANDRSIEGWEDRAEKLRERRKLCFLIFDFRSKRASEARSPREREKVFGFGKEEKGKMLMSSTKKIP